MAYADLAVECDGCKTDILERTILVCKKWLGNYFAGDTWRKDREQELILAFQRYWIPHSELYEKDLPEKFLDTKATCRLADWQLAQLENSINLREVERAEFEKDLAEFEKDLETIKREKEAGIEPDQKKVVLCENKLNELRARASNNRAFSNNGNELRAFLDKLVMTCFRAEVSLEWFGEQLDQREQELTDRKDNFCIIADRMKSELEPLSLQFASNGAAIDREIEQLVPSLSQHHQELVYAWLQSKWEVREAIWGSLYGKLKAAIHEQKVKTFKNLEQPIAPVVVPVDASGLINGLSPDGFTLRWGGVCNPLSPTSSRLVKLLVDAFNKGFPYLHEEYLKTEGEFESDVRNIVRDSKLESIVVREVGADGKNIKGKWGLIDPKKVLPPQ